MELTGFVTVPAFKLAFKIKLDILPEKQKTLRGKEKILQEKKRRHGTAADAPT